MGEVRRDVGVVWVGGSCVGREMRGVVMLGGGSGVGICEAEQRRRRWKALE